MTLISWDELIEDEERIERESDSALRAHSQVAAAADDPAFQALLETLEESEDVLHQLKREMAEMVEALSASHLGAAYENLEYQRAKYSVRRWETLRSLDEMTENQFGSYWPNGDRFEY